MKLDARFAPAVFGKARVLCNAQRFGPAEAAIDLYFACSDGSNGMTEAAQAVVLLCQNASVA